MRCESHTHHPLITGRPRGRRDVIGGRKRGEREGVEKEGKKQGGERERGRRREGRNGGMRWNKRGEIEKGEMEVIAGEIY